MQFSPVSLHFVSLRTKYSPQHSVFKHPHICLSVNVRDQVSHPYRTTGTITVLFTLVFRFLTADEKTKAT
jgi:hypothetical protein